MVVEYRGGDDGRQRQARDRSRMRGRKSDGRQGCNRQQAGVVLRGFAGCPRTQMRPISIRMITTTSTSPNMPEGP